MLTAFFYTFVKQARLWEMQYAIPQETVERAMGTWPSAPISVAVVPEEARAPENGPSLLVGEPTSAKQRSLRVA
jgi:hypothetical protein